MPNPHSHTPPAKPTPRQQRFLRQLAEQTGTSFTPPQTKVQAVKEIQLLLARKRGSRGEQIRDRRSTQADLQTGAGDAVRFTNAEVTGHGSSARWAHHTEGEGR